MGRNHVRKSTYFNVSELCVIENELHHLHRELALQLLTELQQLLPTVVFNHFFLYIFEIILQVLINLSKNSSM